jgi:hypothetical protein
MPTGFDTTANCAAKAAEIRDLNYDFVARYLSSDHWKVIVAQEAEALSDEGLAIVLVYEDGPTADTYFSTGRGQADAMRAAQQASLIGAPDNTTIYFAVDYDASAPDITGVITQYFQAIGAALNQFAADGNRPYRIGVYGSGATCAGITGAGLAGQGWLADATGWRGHGTYIGWSISQGLPTTVAGLSVDPDTARDDYGAIAPGSLAVA